MAFPDQTILRSKQTYSDQELVQSFLTFHGIVSFGFRVYQKKYICEDEDRVAMYLERLY